jgi:hypothetical protein
LKEEFMSGPNVCFNTSVYNKTLNILESLGFDVTSERTEELSGKYYCSDDAEFHLIDLDKRITGMPEDVEVWISQRGNAYQTISIDDMPDGVAVAMGYDVGNVQGVDKIMFDALFEIYNCVEAGDKECIVREEKRATLAMARLKIEKKERKEQARQERIKKLIDRRNMISTKISKLLKLMRKCDRDNYPNVLARLDSEGWRYAHPQTEEDAKRFVEQGEEILKDMMKTGAVFNCLRKTTVRGLGMMAYEEKGDGDGCAYGVSSPSVTGFVTCPKLGIKVSHTRSWLVCNKPSEKSEEKSNWHYDRPTFPLHGRGLGADIQSMRGSGRKK